MYVCIYICVLTYYVSDLNHLLLKIRQHNVVVSIKEAKPPHLVPEGTQNGFDVP